jgi:hypothetical protein
VLGGPIAREATAFARFSVALPRHLRKRTPESVRRARLLDELAQREERLCAQLSESVFDLPNGVYRPLFDRAGIEREDALALVRDQGVEGALERFFDAGVRVSIEESSATAPPSTPHSSGVISAVRAAARPPSRAP